jgi:chromosome segregation ATPase
MAGDVHQQLTEMTNNYHSLQEESEKHRVLYEELQNQYRLNEERSEEMAEQLTALEDQITKLNSTIAERDAAEIESQRHLTALLAEKEQTIKEQQAEVSRLTEHTTTLQSLLEERTKELETQTHVREQETATQSHETEELITKLQSTISELSDTLATMNSENDRLVTVNEKFKDELGAKNSVISLKDLEIRELEGKLSEREKEVCEAKHELENTVSSLHIEIQNLKLEFEQKEMSGLEELREQHERAINELNQQILQHQHDLEAMILAKEFEMRQSKQEELDRTTTTETLLSLQDELTSVSSNLTSSINEIKQELEAEKESHARDVKEKEEEIKKIQNENQELLEKIENLTKDHAVALQTVTEDFDTQQQQQASELHRTVSEKDSMIQQLEESLEEVKGELVLQTTVRTESEQSLSQMTAQNQDLLIKIQRLEEQRKILEESCNDTSTSMSGQVSELLKQINDLNLLLDDSRAELHNQQLSSEKNLLEAQEKHLLQVQEIEVKCHELIEKLNSLTEESNSSKLHITTLSEQMSLLQTQLQEAESISRSQEEELTIRQTQLTEVETECSDLTNKYQESEATRIELEAKIIAQTLQIEELNKEKESLVERETELNTRLDQLQKNETAATTRVLFLEGELVNFRNELEGKDTSLADLKNKLIESEERGREGTDEKDHLLRALEAERKTECEKYSQERSEFLLRIVSLEQSLEEQRKETDEEKQVFEEKLSALMKEKEQLEERVKSQVESYALLQESFEQISRHDEQLNEKYTDLLNEFHEYKIQHPKLTSPSSETTSGTSAEDRSETGRDIDEASGAGSSKDEIKLNDQLKQKIIFEEENLYLKNQIQLLENDKEENEKTLSSLQEKLNAYQVQLAQRQEEAEKTLMANDDTEKRQTAEAAATAAAAALENSQLEEIRTTVEQLQRENDELITSLIETKLQAACHASETDEERKKLFALKRKLQLYAERVATLEVTVAERMGTGNETADNGDKKFRWGKKK